MRLRVNENGLVIPPSFLVGLEEVEIKREGDIISIEKVNKNSSQESIDIFIVKGKLAQNLLQEKLKIIKESRKNTPENPAKVALAKRFRELCREIQELHTDNPLSDAEIDAVRIRE